MRGVAAVLAGALLRGGELAGVGRNGTPGLGLACGLAWEGLRGARDPLVGSRKGCIGRRGWPAVTGGLGSPAYRVSAVPAPFGSGFRHWEHLLGTAKLH